MPQKITNDDIFAPIVHAVKEVADAARDMKQSELSEKAILVLIAHETKLPQGEIKAVLDAAAKLDKLYLK